MAKLEVRGFDWDKGNKAKCKKHGLSIKVIESVFLKNEPLITPDLKHSHKETRFIAIATIKRKTAFIVFTMRKENLIRPISARYMHKKEIKLYEEKNSGF